MTKADGRRVAAAYALSANAKGRTWSPPSGGLTQAAGDDIRAVLGEDKGVDERQVHGGALQTAEWAGGRARSKGATCIFAHATAVHGRRGSAVRAGSNNGGHCGGEAPL